MHVRYTNVMHKGKMERLKKFDKNLVEKIIAFIKVVFVAWAFGVIGWCLSRVVDRSEWAINNLELVENHLRLYVLVMFQVVPLVFAAVGGVVFRKVKPVMASALFALSVVMFIWVA